MISLDSIYPVGYIYETTDSNFDANSAPGFSSGTWTLMDDAAANVSTTASANLGNYVGANTVTLTTAQMTSHNHGGTIVAGKAGNSTGTQQDTNITNIWNSITVTTAGSQGQDSRIYGPGTTTFVSKGGGQAHNNMQPYKIIYKWKRIS